MAEARPRGAPSRTPWVSRALALLALAAVAIAVVVVVNGSLATDDDGSGAAARTETTTSDSDSGNGDGDGAENPKIYTVESGDLLSTIAEKFGVSVDRLVRLNPDVDPQTLNPGTELKIR